MAGNENRSPEILVATIDDAKLIYIFDKIKKIFGDNVSVEYLSGPNIKINELNEKKFLVNILYKKPL